MGPCGDSYELGFLIGERFSSVIRSRVDKDLILQKQLLPFASTDEGKSLIEALERSNQERYPRYWDELVGTASGSGVPFLHVHLYPLPLISFLNLTFCLVSFFGSNASVVGLPNLLSNWFT